MAALSQSRAGEDEPDRLAGFAAPREVSEIFGHEPVLAEFERALQADRLPQGWLLAGPEGIGKATLAYKLGRRLLALNETHETIDPDNPKTPLFAQVAGRAHPNLLVLNRSFVERSKRYSQWIGVDAVRRLRAFLGATASQSGYRVVLVDRADELNINAANALLKALEEPPEKTVFLLVAVGEGRLPVTIRSRCRVVRLEPLAEAPLRAATEAALGREDADVPPEALSLALSLSGGSVRRALEFATGEGVELYGAIVDAFRRLPGLDEVWLQGHAEALAGAGNSERFETFFALLLSLIERLVREAATGQGAATEEERKIAAGLIPAGAAGAWAELWEDLRRSYSEVVGLNLDRSLFVLESFLRLQRLARALSV